MRQKHNRNRNTISVLGGDQYLKSRLAQALQQLKAPSQCLQSSQKTNLCLKLLQKCSQKMFLFKDQQYSLITKDQSDFNIILSRTTIDTRKKDLEMKINRHAENQVDFQERKNKVNNSEKKLISSWTAFENLDITYITREDDLMKENVQLRKEVSNTENKLKALYLKSDSDNVSISPDLLIGVNTLSLNNLEQIQSRIQEHQILIKKLKQKIQKKQQQKDEQRNVLMTLMMEARQKYGSQIGQRVKEMFGKLFQQV